MIFPIVEATDSQRILRWLGLPLQLRDQPNTSVWGAGEQGRVLGAAVCWSDRGRWFMWGRVLPSAQRQGLGTELLGAIFAYARRAGVEQVFCAHLMPQAQAQWLMQKGATVQSSISEFSASLRVAADRLERAWGRMQRQQPASAKIYTMKDVAAQGKLSVLADLLVPAVGGNQQRWLRRATAALEGQNPVFDPECSLVLCLGDRIVGAQTTRYQSEGHYWFNEAITIAPDLRNGWASIMLRRASEQAKTRMGLSDEVRFRARPDQLDTLRMADHLGARKLGEFYTLAIDVGLLN